MTKKVIETVNGWYMENPKQKVELDDIVGLVKTDEPTDSVQLKKEAQLSIYEKRIIELENENKQLKQQLNRLYNYFEDWYSDMTSANDFNEIWDNVKEDERWGDMEFTPSCTRHLKKSDFESLHSIIDGYEINCKLEELRRLGYSDEYINKELSHLVNWRI